MISGSAEVPVGRRSRDPFLHVAVVEEVMCAHPAQVGQTRPMPHHVPDGDLRLAVSAELRPVLGNRGVVIDQPSVGQPMNDRG